MKSITHRNRGSANVIIAILITIIVLAIGGIVTILLVRNGKKEEKKEKETSSEMVFEDFPTEVATEGLTDEAEKLTSTEVATEELTTEALVTDPYQDADMKSAYLKILSEHETYIRAYAADHQYNPAGSRAQNVFLTDFTGDGYPELVFIQGTTDTADTVMADANFGFLFIYSYDSATKTVIALKDEPTDSEHAFDLQVAGGTKYQFFQTSDPNVLYASYSISDECTDYSLIAYSVENGQLKKDGAGHYIAYGLDGQPDQFSISGKEVSQADYYGYLDPITSSITKRFAYNHDSKDAEMGYSFANIPSEALSYDDAVSKLQ